ncbi:hypothetical protein [Maridesulfovibrio sp.]|uniref:hypothetical protein n=1 Tax=Maridesulfovibrio sp. TaxID=2795000 RepID=UPI003B00006D
MNDGWPCTNCGKATEKSCDDEEGILAVCCYCCRLYEVEDDTLILLEKDLEIG